MNNTPFDQIQNDASAYMKSCVISALAELDFGTLLIQNDNSLTASKIAHQAQCDVRACEMLLDATVSLGYFTKDKDHYSVAEPYKELLDSTHPKSSVAILRHYACIQRKWMRLAWTVKNGAPQEEMPSILGAEQDRVSFIMGMNSIGVQILDGVISSLLDAQVFPKKDTIKILDVGGASGTYTQAFLETIENSVATIFDLSIAIKQSQKRFYGTALENRVTTVAGDFYKDDLPVGFDFVWLSAIIHQMNPENSRMIYKKIFNALEAGGVLAIRDYVMNEDRTAPLMGSLFGINMLVNTSKGMVYTFNEIKADLENTGFIDVRHAVDVPTMSSIVTAKKPD